MRKIILLMIYTSILSGFTSAATVLWNTVRDISGDGDVSTSGIRFTAQALSGGTVTVNTVPFTAFSGAISSDTNLSLAATYGISSAGIPSNLSSRYTSLLSNGIYLHGSNGILTLNNLTLGRNYQVELFSNDSRAFTLSFGLILSAGNSVTVLDRPVTSGPEGLKGQYVIGMFTANSPSEIINLNPGSGFPFLNAVQVRELSMYAQAPGYASMGTVLDNFNVNNVAASTILTALGNVPDFGITNALGELSPKPLEIFSNVANNVATFNAAKINNHLANRRDGLTGFDSNALDLQDSSMDSTLNQVRDHLLAFNPNFRSDLISDSVDSIFDGVDMKSAMAKSAPTGRWSSFIAGDVILADVVHNQNLESADYTTGNVTAGLDCRLDDYFTVGVLFSYSHTAANLDSRGSSATVDSYSPGLYASYVDQGWYGNSLATYGRNAYTSDRVVDIPGITGDNHGATNGYQNTINLTGGYEFERKCFKFGPVASVQFVHLALDAIQEQGPTALSIDSRDNNSFRSQLGIEARFCADVSTPLGQVFLTTHASVGWQHEYLDDSRGINAQFSGTEGGSFITQTDNPDRNAAFIDVGLDTNLCKNVTAFVDYETQAGGNNYFAQSAQGGIKIGF